MSIKYSLVVVALLVGAASGASFDRIIQLQEGDSQLIAAGRSNYAIDSPLLATTNWETLSVNSNDLLAIGPNCSRIALTFGDLSGEQRELIGKIMKPFEEGATLQEDPNLIVEFGVPHQTIRLGEGVSRSEYRFGKPGVWFLIDKITDDNMSISLGWLGQKELSRIFYVDNTVTFVYTDGRVKTEPKRCLREEDRDLLRDISLLRKEHRLKVAQEIYKELWAVTAIDQHKII